MTTRYEFQNKLGVAMRKRFTREQLDQEYTDTMEKEKKLVYPECDVELRAMMYIVGCAWSEHDMYESINMMYHAYDGIRNSYYNEKELVDSVKNLTKKINLVII